MHARMHRQRNPCAALIGKVGQPILAAAGFQPAFRYVTYALTIARNFGASPLRTFCAQA